jgi:hypothetical protein
LSAGIVIRVTALPTDFRQITPAKPRHPPASNIQIGLSRVANANTAAAVAPSAAANVKIRVGIDAGPRRRMAMVRAKLKGIAIGNIAGNGSRSTPIAAAVTTSPAGSLLLTQRHHHRENG